MAVAGFAGHERNELELHGVALPYFMDGLLVTQLVPCANRMTQHDFFKPRPGRRGFQDGEERTDRRTRGEEPEVSGVGDFFQGEESSGRGHDPKMFSGLKLGQTGRQRAFADDVEMDLVRPLVGRIDHGIRACDAFAGYVHPRANELARIERGQLGLETQRNQCIVPAYALDYGCLYPIAHRLLLEGNTGFIWWARACIQPASRQGMRPRTGVALLRPGAGARSLIRSTDQDELQRIHIRITAE